nr:MAG TPA: hypothetical protein [Bacteriophage sp.]
MLSVKSSILYYIPILTCTCSVLQILTITVVNYPRGLKTP